MSKKSTEQPAFEDNIQQLADIVQQLEQGGLSLEQALQQFERGIGLARLSQQQLQAAEQKVQILLQQAQTEQLVPFATGSGEQ